MKYKYRRICQVLTFKLSAQELIYGQNKELILTTDLI